MQVPFLIRGTPALRRAPQGGASLQAGIARWYTGTDLHPCLQGARLSADLESRGRRCWRPRAPIYAALALRPARGIGALTPRNRRKPDILAGRRLAPYT